MKKLLASTALAVTLLYDGCAGADAPDSKALRILHRKCSLLKNKNAAVTVCSARNQAEAAG